MADSSSILFGGNLGIMTYCDIGGVNVNASRKMLRTLDGLVQGVVKSATTATPPTTPANGDAYLLRAYTTLNGVWSGHSGQIAIYSFQIGQTDINGVTSGWEYYTPKVGWTFYSQDDGILYRWNGTNFMPDTETDTIASGANALYGAVTKGKAYRGLDALVMPSVAGYLTNTPPGSPADGDTYIIGAAPTGVWAGNAGKVTRYTAVGVNGSTTPIGWEFYTPRNGWTLESKSARESYRYTSGAWEIFYQEGTWTTTATGIGGTGLSFTTKYVLVGKRADVVIAINGTGVTSASGSSNLTLPFTPARISVCATTDANLNATGSSTIVTDGKVWLPTIASTTAIYLTGSILLS